MASCVYVTGQCSACGRTMPIAARGLCHTCYRNLRPVICGHCGVLRRPHGRGLCFGCHRRELHGDPDGGGRPAILPQYFGPREHSVLIPRPRALHPYERAALREIHIRWRITVRPDKTIRRLLRSNR